MAGSLIDLQGPNVIAIMIEAGAAGGGMGTSELSSYVLVRPCWSTAVVTSSGLTSALTTLRCF